MNFFSCAEAGGGDVHYLNKGACSLVHANNLFNSSCEITVFDGRGLVCQTPTNIAMDDLQGNIVYVCDVGVQNFEPLPNDARTFISTPDKTECFL